MTEEQLCPSSSINEAKAFCQIICSKSTLDLKGISFRLIAEKPELKAKLEELKAAGKAGQALIKVMAGGLDERLERCLEFNRTGYGVYYSPNCFLPGYSEDYEALECYRAAVIDCDKGLELDKALILKPTVVVETSPGKYQLVWVLDELKSVFGTKYEDWNRILTRLAGLLAGDFSATKATQVMRCPGFIHWKGVPFVSRIVHRSADYAKFAWLEEIGKGLEVKGSTPNGGNGHQVVYQSPNLFHVIDIPKISTESVLLGEIELTPGDRHSTLLSTAISLRHAGKTEEEVRERLEIICKEQVLDGQVFLPGGLRHQEFLSVLKDSNKYYLANVAKDKAKGEAEYKAERAKEPVEDDLFNYDYRVGSLRKDRYTERAIVERACQRFKHELACIDNRVFCFNQAQKIWACQVNRPAELEARVSKVIIEMCREDGFKELCLDSKGVWSKSKEKALLNSWNKTSNLRSMAQSLKNYIGIPIYL